jgi:hypothetical protein
MRTAVDQQSTCRFPDVWAAAWCDEILSRLLPPYIAVFDVVAQEKHNDT